MNHTELLNFAINTAKKAGLILMQHFGAISSVKRKSTNIDLVTKADTDSEALIINKIRNTYPDHHIISEEREIIDSTEDYCWIIDPLDGTTNYVHTLPIFSVSIALQYKKKTILGVVYNPEADKCFWAIRGKGSFLNGSPINITSTNTLSDGLLVTGFPYIHDNNWERSFDLFKILYRHTQGIRRLGSAALDFCFVAMGRFEGFWEFGLQPWDICAGSLILEEAGGQVTDWDNSPMSFSGKRVLATNGYIHKEMITILSKELV